MNSLQRLQELNIAEIVPGHGPAIRDAQAKIEEYIAHRRLREQQILDVLQTLPRGVTIPEMVPVIYTDVDSKLHSIAEWTVEAHLLKLEQEGLAERIGEKGWALVDPTA
jgi:glyoxylase-like metal-dependent hydrolase (beta-lactamase superfamily II)